MNCRPVILNEPLLPSESYQGERSWEVLRRLSYWLQGDPGSWRYSYNGQYGEAPLERSRDFVGWMIWKGRVCLKGLTRCYARSAETIEWDLYHSFSRLSLLSVRAVTVKVTEKEKQLGFQMKDTFLIPLNSLSSVLLLGRTIRCYRSSGKSHFFPFSVKQLVIVPFKFDFCRRQYHVTWAGTKTS